MEQERLSKGIWIPIEIWKDKNLTWNEKILFLEIDSYTSREQDCFFSNEYISDLLGISETNANKTLSSLINKGYVIKTKFDGRRRYVKTALSFSTTLPCQERQPSHACASNTDDNYSDNYTLNKTSNKEENSKKEDDEFVERMYKLYPTRCPVRNVYLGKCYKDKERIKRLLKTYSQEDIERVIKHEIDEKYGKSYMSNFSTFLNNFPDPSELFSNKSYGYPKDINDVKEEDVQHKLDFFNYWIEKKAPNVCDGLSNGRPQTEQQYKSLIEHTEGGARALCYVVLVLNRDGWEQYADERGFMWVYSNYIKANGLYKG